MDLLSTACRRLEEHDDTLTLLNLSCRSIGSEGVIKLAKSCMDWSVTSAASAEKATVVPSVVSSNDDASFFSSTTTSSSLTTGGISTSSISSSSLVALWLEGNDIYPAGARALRTILLHSPRLKYLYLSSNNVGNAGVSALATIAFSRCEVCHWGDNQINDIGAISIAESLQEQNNSPTIQTLVLNNNRLGDQGMQQLVEGLKHNTSLKRLDVRYNNIGTAGLIAIRDMLQRKENVTLEVMLLEEENFVDSQRRQFQDENESNEAPMACHRRSPTRRRNRRMRLVLSEKQTCRCKWCQLCYEIEYYLALNRAGQRYFGDITLPSNLWPQIMNKVTKYDTDDPSVLFTMLQTRPDVAFQRQ